MLKCISTAQARTKCVSAFWAQFGLRHFTRRFPYKVALVKCWSAFRLRRLAHSVCLRSGLNLACGILPVNFRNKVALVKCWSAFRLRRLAQSVCPVSGLKLFCGILPVNFRIKWLLWNVEVHFDCAGSHKVCVRVLGSVWSAAFYP